jgi:hypothetical protein
MQNNAIVMVDFTTQGSVILEHWDSSHVMLTLPDTASKHHTLPSDISCCESLHDLVPEKDFPEVKSLTRYADMQHLRSNLGSLGRRSRRCSFCQLRSGTHVVVSRRCCLQRSRKYRSRSRCEGS